MFSLSRPRRGGLRSPAVNQGKGVPVTNIAMKPRLTSFAPQFLVDNLERSIAHYNKLGFAFGDPWGGFYGKRRR